MVAIGPSLTEFSTRLVTLRVRSSQQEIFAQRVAFASADHGHAGTGSRLKRCFISPTQREGDMAEVKEKPHQLIASDRVEGTAVRRPNGDMIGHIERLMIDKLTGKVSYAILSFGGFLGMGTNLLPLPWARLTYNTTFEAYELDIDDEELRRAPSFRADRDFDWGDRSKEVELHQYYGIPPYWGGF
jgi:hypothetical protein